MGKNGDKKEMSHKRNTDKIVRASKTKSEDKRAAVFLVIKQMDAENERISITAVRIRAGVSKSFIYKHADIRALIESYTKRGYVPEKKSKNQEEIEKLRKRVKQLESESKNYENDKLLRERYERLLAENKELKKQLEVAYANYR
jgi:hypothetical protein